MIDVLILSFNKVNQTIKCLKSVLPSGTDIYILDNGSCKMQLNELRNFCDKYPKINLFESSINLGVSGGRNFLINKSKGQWLFFLDNDTYLWNRNWFSTFKSFVKRNCDAKIVVPRLYNLHNNSFSPNLSYQIKDNEIILKYGSFNKPNLFPGGAVIIRKSIFDQVGLYDDNMLVGFEDFELGIRPYFLGLGQLEIHLTQEITIIHDHTVVKNKSNVDSVKIRYDVIELTNSFDRIINKYGFVFNHEYLDWTKQQTEQMLNRKVSILDKIKRLIKMRYDLL